jgi:C4-dicarboxylate transporter DctM subunit
MTGFSETIAPRPRAGAVMASLIVAVPIALALVCVLARFDIIALSQSLRAALLFAMLLALMATGMPISIALGLSVLTYLFILSSVDPKMVGLKLFTSIDRFEIMAIPFFILAGNFLTAGGVARRMIDFATSLIGHWYGGLGWRASSPASPRSRAPWWRRWSASAPSSCRRSWRTAIRRGSAPA